MARLRFYSEHEADQFVFYRIPKILFTDKRYSKVSTEAKVLYGLLLDRMALSRKNGWVDEEGHVYIYFKLEEVLEFMGIGKEKGVRLFAELDEEKGCGLILRKKQGQGKPVIIYVLNANSYEDEPYDGTELDTGEEGEFKTSEKPTSRLPDSAEVWTSEKRNSGLPQKPTSRLPKNRSLDFQKTDSNNNEFNNNKNNNTEFSDINPIKSYRRTTRLSNSDVMDEIDERQQYRELILENIEYDILLERNYATDEIDGLVDIMLDLVCSKKDYVSVNGTELPKEVVKSRMLKIGFEHIEYVLDCLKKNTTKVRNIKSYLTTSLYNAPMTIGSYYTAEVNHDLYGVGKESSF